MRLRAVIAWLLACSLAGCGGEEAADISSSTTGSVPTSGTSGPVSTTGTTAAPTTTTEPPTTTAPLLAHTWGRAAHDEATLGGPGDQEMKAVVVGGAGLVAVGADGSGGDWDAAVWVSADGAGWTRLPPDEAVFGGSGDQKMVAVVAGGPGLVAVGLDGPHADSDGAVWTSVDGLTWERVQDTGAALGGPGSQFLGGVAAGGPGLVAVGYQYVNGEFDGAVWTSPDGEQWSRVTDDGSVFGGPDAQIIYAVTGGGPGMVAVGLDGPLDDFAAAVWTSSDGLTWARADLEEAYLGMNPRLFVVAAAPTGLLAAGEEGPGVGWVGPNADLDAAVWVSADGLTWTTVPDNPEAFGGLHEGRDQVMRGLAAVAGGWVAVGYDGPLVAQVEGDADAAVWVSVDGITWERVFPAEAVFGGPDDRVMWGVAAFGPGAVAVGTDYSSGDGDAAVWVSPPPG